MKFGQVIEYNKRNIFLWKSCRKWGRETSSSPLFFFLKKSFIWGKSKGFAVLFQSLSIVLNLANNKNKIYKDFEYWSRNMLNIDFLKKGLGIVFPPHFVYDFSRKTFVKLYSIGWPVFIAWLSLSLKILVNMCIAIVNIGQYVYFFFFFLVLYEVKARGLQFYFNHFRLSSTWQTIKTKYIKILNIDPEICSILIF